MGLREVEGSRVEVECGILILSRKVMANGQAFIIPCRASRPAMAHHTRRRICFLGDNHRAGCGDVCREWLRGNHGGSEGLGEGSETTYSPTTRVR
jgi:hypothetical protein